MKGPKVIDNTENKCNESTGNKYWNKHSIERRMGKKEKEGWYQREEDASDYGNSSNMSYLTVIPAVWLFHDIPAHSYSNSQGRKNKPEQKRKDQWQYKPGNSQLFPPNFPAQP